MDTEVKDMYVSAIDKAVCASAFTPVVTPFRWSCKRESQSVGGLPNRAVT